MLTTELLQAFNSQATLQVDFVERRKLANVLKEENLGDELSQVFPPSLKAEAQKVNAQYVIFCTYLKSGEREYRIDAKIVDVKTAASLGAASIKFIEGDDNALRQLAFKLRLELQRILQLPVATKQFHLQVCTLVVTPDNLEFQTAAKYLMLSVQAKLTERRPENVLDMREADCSGASTGKDEIRLAGMIIVQIDPATGTPEYHIILEIKRPTMGWTASAKGDCDREAIFKIAESLVKQLDEQWEVALAAFPEQ